MKHIYVLSSRHMPGLVKVGVATDPEHRLKTHASTLPGAVMESVHPVGGELAFPVESEIHARLAAARLDDTSAREWFRCSPAAADYAFFDALAAVSDRIALGTQVGARRVSASGAMYHRGMFDPVKARARILTVLTRHAGVASLTTLQAGLGRPTEVRDAVLSEMESEGLVTISRGNGIKGRYETPTIITLLAPH